jgi:hypothetical protein
LFTQVLVIAHELGYLKLGNISLDGSKIHADASKSKAVSYHYGRLCRAQAAVDQASLLIVAPNLSNHPVNTGEAIPTVNAIPAELGQPPAIAMDCGYFSASNIRELEALGIEPYIATGREPHQRSWRAFLAERPAPPPEEASLIVKMAYKLRTDVGQAIYRLRKCTAEPVIGIIKEVLGFRQFSLRGLTNAAAEWCLVCLAWNLKRLHVLMSD